MALDEPGEKDDAIEDRDLTSVIDKGLDEKIKPLKVDYVDSYMGAGFDISSGLTMGALCGSSCSC